MPEFLKDFIILHSTLLMTLLLILGMIGFAALAKTVWRTLKIRTTAHLLNHQRSGMFGADHLVENLEELEKRILQLETLAAFDAQLKNTR